MTHIFLVFTAAALSAVPHFERHEIADFRDGYQATIADFNGDGRPDVAVLSISQPEVVWYENPTWKKHVITHTAANIDMAPYDIDGDGRPELALASGFYFGDASKGGNLQWLKPDRGFDRPWKLLPIAVDPVTHRVRWGDLDGDGRSELIHIPFFGPGSQGVKSPRPAHLWAFRLPAHPTTDPWPVWKIDETLTMIHGAYVRDVDGSGRASIFTASREGIHRFKWEGQGAAAHWTKLHLGAGAAPTSDKPDAPRGSSEVAFGHLGNSNPKRERGGEGNIDPKRERGLRTNGDSPLFPGRPFLAAIEPWHGNQVVAYFPPKDAPKDALWTRRVLTSSFDEGHGLAIADLDGDGRDEIIAGCRGKGRSLMLFVPNAAGDGFQPVELDNTVAADCTLVADINGDGRPDLVVVSGRTNKVVWYENLGTRK
jgi:hypothetical protein